MAGHSQFKNIMHRKGAQDKKRAKIFTKLIRELTVAAKTSPDPSSNPRLRSAIAAARAANMPKDTMERAIKKGSSGEDTTNYEEVRYEGYGPSGSALIVEALTDNRNRTASEIRTLFNKHGGNLGESNSVSFQFTQQGRILVPSTTLSFDSLFEAVSNFGVTDIIQETNDHYTLFTEPDALHAVAEQLQLKFKSDLSSIELIWYPQTLLELPNDKIESVLSLIAALEENDDVQKVFCNCAIPPLESTS
jgi:YebC/PmpR family DNA-binding regulatory protein